MLKPDGSLWVIGSYHNIFRVGAVLQDLGFWILNDIVWRKANPMPNFQGTRFTNAHETLIWARMGEKARYTFNYRAMKTLERRTADALRLGAADLRRARAAQGRTASRRTRRRSPRRCSTGCCSRRTNPGDVVLDPFFGTGTTGAVAKRLGRHWIGFERESRYIAMRARADRHGAAARRKRADTMQARKPPPKVASARWSRRADRAGRDADRQASAAGRPTVRADGSLALAGEAGSIHGLGAALQGAPSCNGWTFWHVEEAARSSRSTRCGLTSSDAA